MPTTAAAVLAGVGVGTTLIEFDDAVVTMGALAATTVGAVEAAVDEDLVPTVTHAPAEEAAAGA